MTDAAQTASTTEHTVSYKTETSAPLDSLKARGIPERCAAARDLSQIGRLEDIPALVDRAASDRSPAVRLVTAGAVADILSRYRLEPARSTLSDADREELIASFRGIDPETNGGLFSMLACADLPSVLQRLAIGLRDPRGGVRVGAAVGLLRYCVSGAHHGNSALEEQVVEMFSDRRLRPDALAEVARVCAAAGYRTALTPMARLGLDGAHGAFVNQMVDVMQRMDGGLTGVWVSDGRDAGEVNPHPQQSAGWLVLGASSWLIVESDRDASGGLEVAPFDAGTVRRMHYRRVGTTDAADTIQVFGRTWYRTTVADWTSLVDVVAVPSEMDWATPAAKDAGLELIADVLVSAEGDSAASDRCRALVLQAAGSPSGARDRLEAAVKHKRCPADVWFFLGESMAATGESDAARDAWAAALKKARKKDWFVERAQARLG